MSSMINEGDPPADAVSPPKAGDSIPPPLPPSVEEAYRRKCCKLRKRTTKVEEANNAARVRMIRLKRQVEKMRLERAFLLEQLSKRISPNVEDSDGSPSPPPTVRHSEPDMMEDMTDARSQPKEKPLRIKRGHRKPVAGTHDTLAHGPGSNYMSVGHNLSAHSPGSDAFSAQPDASGRTMNGMARDPPRPSPSPYELFCREARMSSDKDVPEPVMAEQLDGGWNGLSVDAREGYQMRAQQLRVTYEHDTATYRAASDARSKESSAAARVKIEGGPADETRTDNNTPQPLDEDVDMNYDTDQEPRGRKLEP